MRSMVISEDAARRLPHKNSWDVCTYKSIWVTYEGHTERIGFGGAAAIRQNRCQKITIIIIASISKIQRMR